MHVNPPYGAVGWSYFQSNTGVAPSTSIWGLAVGANRSGGLSEINLVNNTTNGDGFYLDQSNGSGTYTRLMTIKGNGNVGIAATSPAEKLHVGGNMRIGASGNNTDDNADYKISSGGQLLLQANDSATTDINYVYLILASGNANTTANHGVQIQTKGATRMMVDHTGNVGIATSSPAATLDVVGNARISGGLGDIIYSTQPANRFYAPGTGWYYTGEYLTITVPAGPARRYRITNRQMAMQSNTGQFIMTLSTSSASLNSTFYLPYQVAIGGYWSTINADTYVTLNGGTTTTYYVWMSFSSTGGAVASENRAYCDLFAVQL